MSLGFLNNSAFSLTWRLAWNVLPLVVLESCRDWTAHIDPKQLMLLNVSYIVENIDPPYQGEKCVMFLVILAVARMVIWETRKKGLHDGTNFSYHDLILFFRNQLKVKIRCDRK